MASVLSGLVPQVRDYVFAGSDAADFLNRFEGLCEFLVPRYQREGRSYLSIAIGCTGGRHRSVAMTEALAQRLAQHAIAVDIRHRDRQRSAA